MTSVLIADDQQLQRLAFRALLEGEPGLTVSGEAGHGAEAVRMAADLRPDVVVMDVQLPGLDGIEATRQIAAAGGRTRVLIVTVLDFDEYAYAALEAGASGFLVKNALPGEFVAAIHAVAAGEAAVSPRLTRRMLDAHAFDFLAPPAPPRADGRLAALSERELEVLAAIGRGWTNLEIADRFALTESTVKKHVGSVLAKTGARDRVQAVIIAYDAGLVAPSRQRVAACRGLRQLAGASGGKLATRG